MIFLFSISAFPQSGQKYGTDGNNLSTGDWIGSKNAMPIIIKTNNTQKAVFTSNGWFGLGIAAPTCIFDVFGDGKISNFNVLSDLNVGNSISTKKIFSPTGIVDFYGSKITTSNEIVAGKITTPKIWSASGTIDFDGCNIKTTAGITGVSLAISGSSTFNSISANSFQNILFSGAGNGIVTFDNNGNFQMLNFNGDENSVLFGNGNFGTLPQLNFTAGNGITIEGNTISSLWTTNGDQLYNNTSRFIGICTENPQANLHLKGITDCTVNPPIPKRSTIFRIEDQVINNSQYALNRDVYWDITASALDRSLYFSNNGAGSITDVLTLDENGNVGIGNTVPTEKLEVQGNVKINGTLNSQTISSQNFIDSALTGTGSGLLTFDNNGAFMPLNFNGDANTILHGDGTFGTLPSGGWALNGEDMYSLTHGNIGIGIETPIEKLDVNGNANIRGYLYVQDGVIIGKRIDGQKVTSDTIIVDKIDVIKKLGAKELEVIKMKADTFNVRRLSSGNLIIDGQNQTITSTTGLINFEDTRLAAGDIEAGNIEVGNIEAENITAANFNAGNLNIFGSNSRIESSTGNIGFGSADLKTSGNITANTMNVSKLTVDSSITTSVMTNRILPLPGDSLIFLGRHSIIIDSENNIISYSSAGNNVDGLKIGNNGGAAIGLNSIGIGNNVTNWLDAINSITIGSGWGNTFPTTLFNNKPNSLMIGFNSNLPTLFVGSSNGMGTIGDVGIGTTDPQASLHIKNTVQNKPSITLEGNGTAFMTFYKNGMTELPIGLVGFGDYATNDFYFANIPGNILLNNLGYVGINTSTPHQQLDVQGIIRASQGFQFPDGSIQNSAATNYIIGNSLQLSGSTINANFGTTTGTIAEGNHTHSQYTASGQNGYVQFNNNNSFGGNSNFTWDNSAERLGIGTTSPLFKLHLKSSEPGGSGLIFKGATLRVEHEVVALSKSTWDLIPEIVNDPSGLYTSFSIGTPDRPMLTIKDNGQVGIGTGSSELYGFFQVSKDNRKVVIGDGFSISGTNWNASYLGFNAGLVNGSFSNESWKFHTDFLSNNGGSMILNTNNGDLRFICVPTSATVSEDQIIPKDQLLPYTKLIVNNNGVGINIPNGAISWTATEQLEVNGGIKLSDASFTNAGTIAFKTIGTNTEFGGYTSNGVWQKFGAGSKWSGSQNINDDIFKLNGNIGIGTSSPFEKLEIGGNNNLCFIASADLPNDAGDIIFKNSSGDPKARIWSNPSSNKGLFLNGGGTTDNSTNQDFFINEAGYVGIGTNNPTQKLTVKGKILAQEFEIKPDVDDVGDYVFAKDYKLISLKEVEKYINSNKHLPEIPSAKEFAANGLDLGNMSLLLLKKIEELTLYMIELQKKNEQLEKVVETLKK